MSTLMHDSRGEILSVLRPCRIAISQGDGMSPAWEFGVEQGGISVKARGLRLLKYEFENLTKLVRTEGNKWELDLDRGGGEMAVA